MSDSTSTAKKVIYASPRLGINLFMGLIDFALLYLYEDVYELRGGLVGTSLMLGKLSAAIFQCIIPWFSDHTKTKLGRRKPYLYIMAPILTVSFIMLLLPGLVLGANPPELQLFGWFATFNVLAQGAYAMTTIYHSWTAEQFPTKERPKVSAFQNIFNFMALAVTSIFSIVVLTSVKDKLQEDPTKIPQDYLTAILTFAAIMIGLTYLCTIYMPVEKTPQYTTKFKTELKQILNNKNFLLMTFIQGLSSLGWAMINAVLLSYIDTVMALEDLELYLAAVILFLGLIVSVTFWRKRIESKGKKRTLLDVFLVGIIAPPFSILGAFSFARNFIFGVVFIFFIALMQSGWALFPYIIYADMAEDAKVKDGELKTGLYTGFPALILNVFQAASLYLTGWLTELPVVDNGGPAPFTMGYVIWGPIVTVFFMVTLWVIKKYIKLDFDWEKDEDLGVTIPEEAEDRIPDKSET
ncbi:MAG: MFS transporter [Candidatus Lokiarchaeota archaeon]|nr:MFS transporter [Candidatus Lokiarchaeota archaeon]